MFCFNYRIVLYFHIMTWEAFEKKPQQLLNISSLNHLGNFMTPSQAVKYLRMSALCIVRLPSACIGRAHSLPRGQNKT